MQIRRTLSSFGRYSADANRETSASAAFLSGSELWSSLPPTHKSTLTSKTTLTIYQKTNDKAGNIPKLFPGQICVSDSNPDVLQWNWSNEESLNSFNLMEIQKNQSEDKGYLCGVKAFDKISKFLSPQITISPQQVVAFVTNWEVLAFLFEDKAVCKNWAAALNELLDALEQTEKRQTLDHKRTTSDFIGYPQKVEVAQSSSSAIFDISEPNPPNEMWRDIKVTLGRGNGASSIEYFIYDRTQANLYDSISELIKINQDTLDNTNLQLLEGYLRDITRWEIMDRLNHSDSVIKIRDKMVDFSKYKRKFNRTLNHDYVELNGDYMSKELIAHMKLYEKFDYGDRVTDVIQLIYMQKLSLAIDMHEVCVKAKIKKLAGKPSIDNIGKLDSIVKESSVKKKEVRDDVSRMLEEIVQQRNNSTNDLPESSDKKSFFREVCECRLM